MSNKESTPSIFFELLEEAFKAGFIKGENNNSIFNNKGISALTAWKQSIFYKKKEEYYEKNK